MLFLYANTFYKASVYIKQQNMKLLLFTLLPFTLLTAAFAQTTEKNSNTVTVMAYAKLPLKTTAYKAYIFIQEEETKVGYATIGKTPIDSIRQKLLTNLKQFGIEEKEALLSGTSSKELGQFPGFLINNVYECKLKSKELAVKLVNELRFAGLKGIVVRIDVSAKEKEQLAEAVYNEAVTDAKKTAALLAAKANKTVGEIKNIDLNANSLSILGNDYESDNFNVYSYSRFEMDYRDKYAYCNLRVVFEMK